MLPFVVTWTQQPAHLRKDSFLRFFNYKLNVSPYFKALIYITLGLSFIACDEELPVIDADRPILPQSKTTLSNLEIGQGEGNWDKSLRAATIDQQDIIILSSSKERIEGALSKLVINVPLIDKRTNEDCLSGMRALEALPEKTVPLILDRISEKGLSFDEIIVQVDLLTPNRESIYYQCLEESGSSQANFYLSELRRETLSAFTGLARLSEIDAVVIGLALNSYETITPNPNVNLAWDIINLVDLYHEIYDEMKALNAEQKIGPSVSWAKLKLHTVPAVAEEFALGSDELLTLELALQRSIWPFLSKDGVRKADFIGVSLIPDQVSPPYLGNPNPDDNVALQNYYRNLGHLANPSDLEENIPIAFTSLDWATTTIASGGQKADYLITLKNILSNIEPKWVAWRRLSDIPVDPPQSSPCASVMRLNYGKDFCFAGLLNYNGMEKDVWTEFTKDPE